MPARTIASPCRTLAVALGGLVGADLGARQLAETALRRILAVVLAIAGLKLILTRS